MSTKRKLVVAVHAILKPVVRVMIALGFNSRDFMEVTKAVYVEVATESYGKRSRKANISRVALLTGLTRREVSRLRKVIVRLPLEVDAQRVPVSRVLTAWHTDPRYLSSTGQPATLERMGAYLDLINEHRGDLPATTLTKELELSGIVESHGEHVIVQSSYYMPLQLNPEEIERFGRVNGDAAELVAERLFSTADLVDQDETHQHRDSITLVTQQRVGKI
jgi:hypothetical protein